MGRLLNYRSAAVPGDAAAWVVGPGELRAALVPARRWLRAAAAVTVLGLTGVCGLCLAGIVATEVGRSGLQWDLAYPAAAAGLLAGLGWQAVAEFRAGSPAYVLVDGGTVLVHDPTRTRRSRGGK